MIMKAITVAEHQRALMIRDGKLQAILGPGRTRVWLSPHRVRFELHDVRQAAFRGEWARVIEKNHPELAEEHLEIVRTGTDEAALVSFEGQPAYFVGPNETLFAWKALRDITVERIDLTSAHRIDPATYEAWRTVLGTRAVQETISEHGAGLVYVDGALVEKVGPGRHAFWAVGRTVRVVVYDLSPAMIEIAAQEILTKDRISVRLTLTAFERITDVEAVAAVTRGDYENHVYRIVQLAAREAVGGRTLDELLNERTKVDAEITEQARERLAGSGLDLREVKVKDVILPGEMRALLNKVVEAEKAAQANLIRRQEETAATRSLLNTARLMDDNPTLMRLKELEALEKLTEKIGRIDLHAGRGEGLDALLSGLVRIGSDAEAS